MDAITISTEGKCRRHCFESFLRPLGAPTNRVAPTSSGMPLAQRARLQNSMLESHGTLWSNWTKHKSIPAVTYHLNRKQINIQCNHSMSTDSPYRTWNNHKPQSLKRMHAWKMSTILFWMHPLQNRNFTWVFDVQRPFRAKGLRPTPQNRSFTSVFGVQRPFRAKGLRRTPQNRNFT